MDSTRDIAQDFLPEQLDHGKTFITGYQNTNSSHAGDAPGVEIDCSGVVSTSSQSFCASSLGHTRDLTNSFLGDEPPRPCLPKYFNILEEDNFLNISNGISSMPGFKLSEESVNFKSMTEVFHGAENEQPATEHSVSEQNFGFKVLDTFSLQMETGGFSQGGDVKPLRELSAEGFYRCGYKRGVCYYNTQIPAQFEMHLQEAHQGTGMFCCVHCGSVETTRDGFMQHLDQHLQLKCTQLLCLDGACDFSASAPEELLGHLITHGFNVPLGCWQCGQEFESLKDMLPHVKENLLQIVQCPHCSATDVDRKRIVKHICVSHPGCCRMVSVHKVLICHERMLTSWWDYPENETVAGAYMALGDATTEVPHQTHGSIQKHKSAEKDKINIPAITQDKNTEHLKNADLCQEKKIGIIQPLTVKTDERMAIGLGNLQRNEFKQCDSFFSGKSKLASPRSKNSKKCAPDSLKMKCRFCDMVFPEEYYIRHIYNIHPERFSGFACTTCDFISTDQDVGSTHRCTTLRLQPKSKFSLLSENLLSQHVEEEFVQNHRSPCHKRKLHPRSSSSNSPLSKKKHPKTSYESTEEEGNAKTAVASSVPQKSRRICKGKPIHCRLCGICTGHSKWGGSLHIYKKHPEVLQCPICKFCPVNQLELYKHLNDYHPDVRDSLYQKMNVRKYLDFQGVKKQKADAAPSGVEDASCSAPKKVSPSPEKASEKKCPKTSYESTESEKEEENVNSAASSSVPRKSRRVCKGKPIHCRLCGICTGHSKWGGSLHIYNIHPKVLQCPICKFCPVNQLELYKHLNDYHPDVRDSLYQKMNVRKYLDFQEGKKQKADAAPSGAENTSSSAPEKVSPSPRLRTSLLTGRKSHSECTACWPKSASPFKTSSAAGNKAKSKTKLFRAEAELKRDQRLEQSSCRTRGIDAWREAKTSVLASGTESPNLDALDSTKDEYERVPSPEVFPTEMEYRCPHCVSVLKTSDRFYSHLCYHYHYKVFKCGYCLYKAFSKKNIMNHISALHPENSTAPKVEQVLDCVKENRCRFQMEQCCVPVSQPYDQKRLKKMQDAGKINPKSKCSSKVTSTETLASSHPETSKLSIKEDPPSQAKISKVDPLKESEGGIITDKKEILVMCPYCRGELKAMSAVKREIMGHLRYKKYSCPYCSQCSCSEIKIKTHIIQHHRGRPVRLDIKINEHKEQRVAVLLKKSLKMSKGGQGLENAVKNKLECSGLVNILGKQTVFNSSKTRTGFSSEDSDAASSQDGTMVESVPQHKQSYSFDDMSFRPRDYFTVFQSETVRKVQCLHCSLVLDTSHCKFPVIYKKIAKHVYCHMPRIYPCQLCGRRFYPMSALHTHMKSHQRAPPGKPLPLNTNTNGDKKRVDSSMTGIRLRDFCVVEMHGNRLTRRCLRCDFHIQGAVGDRRIFDAMRQHLYKHMKTIQCFYCNYRSYPCFKVKSHIRKVHRGKPIKWKILRENGTHKANFQAAEYV